MRALLYGAVLALALVGGGAAPALGQEAADEPALGIEVHAFLSQGFVLSTDNNYLTRSKDGSVEFTEAAVNFTKWVTDDLRIGIQLFARKLAPNDDYVPSFDWFYADYRVADWLGVRAGRTKIPFGLYNEANDVDAARVPILLPQSIYPDHHRELLLAQNGGELYGTIPVGAIGDLEYRLYGGTFSVDASSQDPNPNLASAEAEVSYIAGGRVLWLTPLEGLIAGISLQSMRYEIDSQFKPEIAAVLVAAGVAPADFDGSLVLEFPITLWVASLEHTFQDVTIAIEYGRWWADLESSVPELVPSRGPTNERFYAMASYRVNEYFVPGMYFASYYEDVDARGEPGKFQHDLALTLRFDLTTFWLLKAEAHLIRGTALLSQGMNGGKELKDLESRWGLFLLKTTAYF